MKIKFDKGYKKVFTVEDMEHARIFEDAWEDKIDFEDEFHSLADLVTGYNKAEEFFKKSAKFAKNCRLTDPLYKGTGDMDIWLDITFKTFDTFYEVGAYLSDVWSIAKDNKDEIRSFAYIRKYECRD